MANLLPKPFTTGSMRALPILLLFGSMFDWLWKVRHRRPWPEALRHEAAPFYRPLE